VTGVTLTLHGVTSNGSTNTRQSWQHLRDFVHGALSLDALLDSSRTLAANFNGPSSDLVAGNVNSEIFRRFAATGSSPFFAASTLYTIRNWAGKSRKQYVMSHVRAILDLCQTHGTRAILFINPVHADQLELLDLLGYWSAFESWKRELVALTAKYPGSAGYGRIPLWDFSGYNTYTTEAVTTDHHVLRWFWESRHYTWELGDVIVRRIFGGGDTNFGVLLDSEGLDAHLAAIREQQRLFREKHPTEVRRVHDLYESVDGLPSHGVH